MINKFLDKLKKAVETLFLLIKRFSCSLAKIQEVAKNNIICFFEKAQEAILLWKGRAWQRMYALKAWGLNFHAAHGSRLSIAITVLLMILSVFLALYFQSNFDFNYFTPERIDSINALLLTLGGALIGATAIAFSLIMFAMQVNVERMPHGLFRKLSSDSKLLGIFVLTFSLAVIVAVLSLVTYKAWMIGVLVTVFWCSVLVILLFVLAYRRALTLISPTKQLALLVNDTGKKFKSWGRAAARITPVIKYNSNPILGEEKLREKYDMDRYVFFQLNPNWTAPALRAISYCMAFSRRYADQGDHEVSRTALGGVVNIHFFYVKEKGRTFFSSHPLVENPLVSDDFLLDTLEHVRNNVQNGLSRRDEQFIEQNFSALRKLTELYLAIDYGTPNAERSHAHLVSGYLESLVESVVSHDMPDVLIEGVSVLGLTGRLILTRDRPDTIATIFEKIGLIARLGAVQKNYRPVTVVAVKQLAALTIDLLKNQTQDVSHALKKVREEVKGVAEIYLQLPNTSLVSVHSSSLAPYYSGSSADSFMSWLTTLTDALSKAEANDEVAGKIIANIAEWADGIYDTEKRLLLLSIEKQSGFTFDVVHWIVHITKLLVAVSCADACDEHHRQELRKSASWLISVLSWIPDDSDSIRFAESYLIADNIFEAGWFAHRYGCLEEVGEIRSLLRGWLYKAGKYQTGWATLKTTCCGLACLNLMLGMSNNDLLSEIYGYLASTDAPNNEIRSGAARGLRVEADSDRNGYGHGSIDVAMSHVEQGKLRELLHQVADLLDP